MKHKGILIVGQMGAGKTTLAKMIAESFRIYDPCNLAAFGDALKNGAQQHMTDLHNKREIYQQYGQSMREIFGADVWVRALDNHIKNMPPHHFNIVHDGRQPNEVAWAKEKGYLVAGIIAPEDVRAARLLERDGYDQSGYMRHETEENALYLSQHEAHMTFYNGSDKLGDLQAIATEICAEVEKA